MMAQAERIIFLGPSKRSVVVMYSLWSAGLSLVASAITAGLLSPVGSSSASLAGLVALWFSICAALITWLGRRYQQAKIVEMDGCIVFFRGTNEYRRIELGTICRVRRANGALEIITQRERIRFYESEMHDENSVYVLWEYFGGVLGCTDLELYEFVASDVDAARPRR